MYTMGVDVGSASSKVVILKDGKDVVAAEVVQVGTGSSGPQRALEQAYKVSGLTREDISYLVVTGYGRFAFEGADKQISEISCHAKGIYHLIPTARTIIDIGGQDAKAIRLDSKGGIRQFFMNDKCAEWKAAENIDYSLYGTPIESTTYKFAKCLQKRFGVIEGITDRNYITNSYHVHVTEKINAFDKLRFESEFQLLSPGGAISYIETANLSNNVEAAIKVIQYIYDHIMYAELNTKSDFCQECGYDGEIQIVENEDGKYIWECPNCGNRDRAKMNIARRTCGYIGVNDFNQGRTQEIKERYVHLGGE